MSGRIILALESSCDETAAAVVRGGGEVLSSVVWSQHELHGEYRGVVPEIASRAHAERLIPVVEAAVERSGCGLSDVDALAVGNRPGLIGSLLVGVAGAKALAWAMSGLNRRVPIAGVDHVHAHLAACLLHASGEDVPRPGFPALGLVISGGHTSLFDCDSLLRIRKLGGTIDDAVGEAFDKVAAMLELGFPGGPSVERAASDGDPSRFELPVSRLSPDSLDFSFSGLKTAVLYAVRGEKQRGGDGDGASVTIDPMGGGSVSGSKFRSDLCASFQCAVTRAISMKVERAFEAGNGRYRSLMVGGGVIANGVIRAELLRIAANRDVPILMPSSAYCIDNAAMIGALAHARLESTGWSGDGLDLTADPSPSDLIAGRA